MQNWLRTSRYWTIVPGTPCDVAAISGMPRMSRIYNPSINILTTANEWGCEKKAWLNWNFIKLELLLNEYNYIAVADDEKSISLISRRL